MIFAFGAHELDTRVYELRRAGTGALPIEPQVFDVLAYLVQHRDRVVSKEELLEKLWPDRFVTEATLTSRLKAARRVVGDTGKDQSIIRTHHGRGYRFVAAVEERDPSLAGAMTCAKAGGQPAADHPAFAHPALDHPAFAQPVSDRPASGHAAAESPVLAAFVGREAELQQLTAALERATHGSRQVVFVAGEAGAGKTTLVEAFLARSAGGARLIARGQCVEHRGSGEPYMPLLDALGRLCREPGGQAVIDLLRREAPSWLVQLSSLLPETEHEALVARTGAAGERMLREFGLFIERLAAERPLILAIEDLHWSDYATLDAIDLVARQGQQARCLIIGTYRPADVKATRHPVHAVSQELRVRGLCQVVDVPLLVPTELDAFLSHRFPDAGFTADLARLVHVRTAGNPLFVGNLVDSWIERRLIERHDAGWVITAALRTLETDVPDTLQHLIEKQIAELDAPEQRLLEAAAVVGRTFAIAALASTLPAAEDDLDAICEKLAREGRFIRAEAPDAWGDGTLSSRFTFTHDLYVDVLYGRIPAVRRMRLHQQIGRVVERAWQGREREHASELALHFQRGLDRERGPRYRVMAAEQALERSAYREAVAHFTGALDLLRGGPASADRDRLELACLCRLAPALIATRGYADAMVEANYQRARELAGRLGDAALLSQTLYGMANMYEYRGAYDVAERLATERLQLEGAASSLSRIESHELLTCSFLHQGRYRESVEHGRKAAAACDDGQALQGEHLVLAVQAYGWMSGALYFAGRGGEALAQSAEALRLATASGDELARASSAIQAAFLAFYRRDAEACRRLSDQGLTIARERRFPFHVACARILYGWWLSVAGRHQDALPEIRAGIRTCRAIGALMDMPLFLAILSEPLAASGDREAALHSLDQGLAIVESSRSFFYAPELHRQRGLLLDAMGRPREMVLEALRRAHRLAEEQESPIFIERTAASLAALEGERPPDAGATGRAAGRNARPTAAGSGRGRRRRVQTSSIT